MDASKFIDIQKQMRHNQNDVSNFLSDLDQWEKEVQLVDESLKNDKKIQVAEPEKLPPVRNSLEKKKRKKKKSKDETKSNEKKKISGYDFRAWDKYVKNDMEKALNEMGDQIASSSSEYETDEDWEIQRRSQQATLEKDRGNQLFKEGKYDLAIECYSRGITCDPTNALLPANRAMALLKQEKFSAAELDCTEALALDPTYIKAYARRGTARIGCGKLKEAKEDFEQVLKLEPSNKQAKSEIEKIEKLLNPKPESQSLNQIEQGIVKPIYKHPDKRSKKPLVRVEIEEIGIDVNEENRRKKVQNLQALQGQTRKTIEKDEKNFDKFVSETKVNSQAKNRTVEDSNLSEKVTDLKILNSEKNSNKVKTVLIDEKDSSNSKDSDLPEPPKTSFQFQAEWKSLQNRPSMRAEYLKSIPPQSYPKVFGQALDSTMLQSVLTTLQQYFISQKLDVFQHLKMLSTVKRFNMAVMFFSSKEKKVIQDLFEYMKEGNSSNVAEINALAKAYML